jgi:DNA primase
MVHSGIRPPLIRDRSDDVERVREATDIVAVVSRYVQLKRAGRNLKACCPFHDEKTPSFNVNPEKQFFKCFGCGAGGSVFDFLMRAARLDFGEALNVLAKEAGIELRRDPAEKAERHRRDELLRVLSWAGRTFVANMAHPEGDACRRYVAERGIGPEAAADFGLGFARPGWRNLLEEAERQKVPLELLVGAGLVHKKDGSVYDAFRNRLTFPIRNAHGQVIAFGARSLDGAEPKYLNSPESPLFRKRQTVYGLERLGKLEAGRPVLVMEGYTDVIMATQWGVGGAVATLGTALTPDQVRLLRRYADRAVLVYDGDRAGSEASLRAIPLVLGGGLDLRVVELPGGEDPCDFFLRRKERGLDELVTHTRELADYLIERGAALFDVRTIEGKRRAAEFFADLARSVDDPVVREALIARVAQSIDVPAATLEIVVDSARARPGPPRPARADGPSPATAPRAAAGTPAVARRKAIRDLVDVCLNRPGLVEERHVKRLSDVLVEESEGVRDLLLRLAERAWLAPEAGPAAIMSFVEDETFRRMLGTLIRDGDDARDLRAQLEGAFLYLENVLLEREITALAESVMLTGSDEALRLLSERKLQSEDLRRRGRALLGEGAQG